MLRRQFSDACVIGVLLFCTALSAGARAAFVPGEFISYGQDNWGTLADPASQLLLSQFFQVYPAGGVEMGIPGDAGNSAFFTSGDASVDYLPTSGTADALVSEYIDPMSTSAGIFGGYVLSLNFDVDFGDAGYLNGTALAPFGDLVLHDLAAPYAYFNGLTVREFRVAANVILGGGALPANITYDDVAALTESLTLSFQGGTPTQFAQDHLTSPEPTAIPEPSAVALAGIGMLVMMLMRRRDRRRYAAEAVSYVRIG